MQKMHEFNSFFALACSDLNGKKIEQENWRRTMNDEKIITKFIVSEQLWHD